MVECVQSGHNGAPRAADAARGEPVDPSYSVATSDDVAAACGAADAAFDTFRELAPDKRARLLESIADEIEARGERLVTRAMAESGLPETRLVGERSRTTGQLRLFARVLREGRWAGVILDPPLPDRAPLPRSDLRQRRIAVGPIAVFGASNFPLAFSVAGGDTASALAAGCPVVARAHPAHPGTSAIAGEAIASAVAACGLPAGVFSLIQGRSHALGAALVSDPRIQAVGFTGSRAGGLALAELAARRPVPIPVYAEMSSVNPVVLFPAALAARAGALAAGFVASLTMGAGQFCTKPGILLALAGPDLDRFVAAASALLRDSAAQVMLTSGIHDAYRAGVEALAAHPGTTLVARGIAPTGDGHRGQAALFLAEAAAFRADPALGQEVFGASSLIVRCASLEEVREILAAMEGQLTATLHMDTADHEAATRLVPLLERKAGRILANGWPTGVEVSFAMVHGGPFPATTDTRTTSVGAMAIDRFLRPVCYQDLPEALLPAMLRGDNPYGLPRLVS